MAFGSGSLADAYIKLHYDSSSLNGDIARVRSVVQSGLMNVAGIAGGILAATGFQALNEGLTGVARGFIEANAQMEQYRVALGVMLKDQVRANRLIMEMEQMARKTPFQTGQLIQAAQLLKGYGFEVEKLLPTLRSIGDAASASPEGMESAVMRISLAIGQMRANGKVMGQEMNQLANAGIPAWEILAEQAGKNIMEVRKMTKEGAITGTQAVEMLLNGFDERFGGMMEKQSKSFGGLMSTMRDTAQILMRNIGEPLFAIAKVRLENLSEWLDTPAADEWAAAMRRGVQSAVEFVNSGITAVFSESGREAMAFAGRIIAITGALAGLVATLKLMKSAIGILALMSTSLPSLAAASAVIALATAFLMLSDSLDPVGTKLAQILNQLLQIDKSAIRVSEALKTSQAGLGITEEYTAARRASDERRAAEAKKREPKAKVDPIQTEMEAAQKAASAAADAEIEAFKRKRERAAAGIPELERRIEEQSGKSLMADLDFEKMGAGFFGEYERAAKQEQAILDNLEQELFHRKKLLEDMDENLAKLAAESAAAAKAAGEAFKTDRIEQVGENLRSIAGMLPQAIQDIIGGAGAKAKGMKPGDVPGAVGAGIGSIAGAVAGFLTGGGAALGGVGTDLARGSMEHAEAIAEAAKALGITEEEMKAIIEKSKQLAEREKARQELIARGVDPSLLPGDEDILGGKKQSPQFMAIDQLSRHIQSSLKFDPAERHRKEMEARAKKAEEHREKMRGTLDKIDGKLPIPVGFA